MLQIQGLVQKPIVLMLLQIQGHVQKPIVLMLLQIQEHVQKLLTAAVRPRFKWDCPANSFPSHWAPQQSNTELFEVDLASPEIASLMEAMRDLQHETVVKVRSFKLYP